MPLIEDLYQQQRARKIELDPFTYSAVFPVGTFLAGATVPVSTSIQADSAFVMRYVNLTMFSGTDPDTHIDAPNALISIFDTGSGRLLQDQPVHVMNLTGGRGTGNGMLPLILPEPKLFAPSTVITTTLTNLDADTAYRVDVAFIGFKVFNFR